MRFLFSGLLVAAFLAPANILAQSVQPDQVVTFSDNSKASTYGHCGDTDLCAVIVYANGDKLSIYSEGAAYCQPYMLHFVKVNGLTTVFEYSRTINHEMPTSSAFGVRCGSSQATQMVMDHGLIHMTVTENHDGTLSIVFTPTEQGAPREQSSGDNSATPSPSP
jgi:hypothetical protein